MQQDPQLVFSPPGVLLPEPQHCLDKPRAPAGLAQAFGLAGAVLQAPQVPGVIAAFPAVKGLGADVKVAAGEAGICPMLAVVVQPLQPLPGLPGELGDPRQAGETSNCSLDNSHDTSIASPMFLNELRPRAFYARRPPPGAGYRRG